MRSLSTFAQRRDYRIQTKLKTATRTFSVFPFRLSVRTLCCLLLLFCLALIILRSRPFPADFHEHNPSPPSDISAVVLFHGELKSLQSALTTWHQNGLLDVVDEVLLFVNGASSTQSLTPKTIPQFFALPGRRRHIIHSPENLPLGLAISRMVRAARFSYVLFLEKDWALIENQTTTHSRIHYGKLLIESNIAHVVRFRHRHNPGVPLHALIMHYGREQSILDVQKNLLCYVHHWQSHPPSMFPGKGRMTECRRPAASTPVLDRDNEHVFCTASEFCQWTNNPSMFDRRWFIENVLDEYEREYKIEFDKFGKTSPFLDFEYYTNWRPYAWTDNKYVVALGAGLFSHDEKDEQKYFNTLWYAHYRLTVDLEELRNQYLSNETSFKALGGVHNDPDSPYPLSMQERYPVDFVRAYQWPDVYTGTLEDQRLMIKSVYKPFLDKHRILNESEWSNEDLKSKKMATSVDWRGYITDLHSTVEKARLIAPPQQPHEMTLTLVTTLLDIGRDALKEDQYDFRRDFQLYTESMEKWLTHKYKKVVYTTKNIADELRKKMSEECIKSTVFEYTTVEELRTRWLGPDNYANVQQIRLSDAWVERASWLQNSPQAKLGDYNPLVMSKMFMLRHAARKNHWNTTHFLFLDAKHNCQNPRDMTPKNDHIIRAHMFDKFLLTHFDYTPYTEVHGFEYTAFNQFCNMEGAAEREIVKVGRGGIFGGSAFVMEYISAMYDVALTATLREGLMGTEENILSILLSQVPQYIDGFNNNWACADEIRNDHYCERMRDHQGYNCAIFDWVARNAVKDG